MGMQELQGIKKGANLCLLQRIVTKAQAHASDGKQTSLPGS